MSTPSAVNPKVTRAHKVFHECAETKCSGQGCRYFHDDSADWRHGCEECEAVS